MDSVALSSPSPSPSTSTSSLKSRFLQKPSQNSKQLSSSVSFSSSSSSSSCSDFRSPTKAISMAAASNNGNSQRKIVTGAAGYVLEDVPHLSDYIPDLPVTCFFTSSFFFFFKKNFLLIYFIDSLIA